MLKSYLQRMQRFEKWLFDDGVSNWTDGKCAGILSTHVKLLLDSWSFLWRWICARDVRVDPHWQRIWAFASCSLRQWLCRLKKFFIWSWQMWHENLKVKYFFSVRSISWVVKLTQKRFRRHSGDFSHFQVRLRRRSFPHRNLRRFQLLGCFRKLARWRRIGEDRSAHRELQL